MSVIVCTICSREKDQEDRPLSAYERYRGDHIAAIQTIARAADKSYYILSGKFGLLKESEPVPNYDYALQGREEIKKLSYLVASRLLQDGIKQVLLYTKLKSTWAPYVRAMELACERSGVNLRIEYL